MKFSVLRDLCGRHATILHAIVSVCLQDRRDALDEEVLSVLQVRQVVHAQEQPVQSPQVPVWSAAQVQLPLLHVSHEALVECEITRAQDTPQSAGLRARPTHEAGKPNEMSNPNT